MNLAGTIDGLLTDLGAGTSWEAPAQYCERHARERPYAAERRLIAAAFASALEDAKNGGPCTGNEAGCGHGRSVHGTKRRRQAEALAWLLDDSDGTLTAVWYAEVLGLDLQAVRASITAGRVRALRQGEIR